MPQVHSLGTNVEGVKRAQLSREDYSRYSLVGNRKSDLTGNKLVDGMDVILSLNSSGVHLFFQYPGFNPLSGTLSFSLQFSSLLPFSLVSSFWALGFYTLTQHEITQPK